MMRKRICIVLSLVMLISTLLIPQNTFAASLPYRNIYSPSFNFERYGVPTSHEKTGKYYIWTISTFDDDVNLFESFLYVSQDGKDKTILRRVPSSEGTLTHISTNGKTIYYGIKYYRDYRLDKCKIYKTTVEGKSHKLITTIKHGSFEGYFNNKIYYSKGVRDPEYEFIYHLYQYDLKTKKHKLVRKNFSTMDMYGQYAVGGKASVDGNDTKCHVINLKTGKATSLPKAAECTTDGKYVYYVFSKWNKDNSDYVVSLRRCSMKGKSVKKLKDFKDISLEQLNRTSVQYYDYKTRKLLEYKY